MDNSGRWGNLVFAAWLRFGYGGLNMNSLTLQYLMIRISDGG